MDKLFSETSRPLRFDKLSRKAVSSMIVGLQREANDYKIKLAEAEYKVSTLRQQLRLAEDVREDHLDANTKMKNQM